MQDSPQSQDALFQEITRLTRDRDRLRALVDNIPGCNIFLKDRESRFVFTNQSHLNTLGVQSLDEVVGRTDFDFFPRELAEQYRRDEEHILQTGEPLIDREEQAIDAHGKASWLLTTKMPLYPGPEGTGCAVGSDVDTADHTRIVGVVGLSRDITRIKDLEDQQARTIDKLDQALHRIKTLSGLLPICSSCKKIRDDAGYWHQVETYVHDHSEASFSHGLCPECADKLYEEMHLKKPERGKR